VVAIKHEVGRPGLAATYEFFKMVKDKGVLLSDPLEANSPLWVEMFGMQWMGTSNYEYWGGKVPEYFALLQEGPQDKAMAVYWQIQPARAQRMAEQAASAGANFIHRYMWKYQAWLNGYNGGPMRQPVMKLTDGQMRRLRDALTRSGMEPENLVIELTESTIMHNTEVNLEKFRALKQLGVRLAIDDFGTGYSSLSYLHRFPIDILKIDRSFVSRLTESGDGPALARAVVMLGETLGLETIAEGIEQEHQVAELVELGCVAGQGFLFAASTSLEALAITSFSERRAELRRRHSAYDRLTATGRYRVAELLPKRSAA